MGIQQTRIVTNTNNSEREFEEAKGFLNLSIEFDNGSVHKLTKKGIPLLESDPVHALLIKLLSADPEKAQALTSKLKITYGQKTAVNSNELQLTL